MNNYESVLRHIGITRMRNVLQFFKKWIKEFYFHFWMWILFLKDQSPWNNGRHEERITDDICIWIFIDLIDRGTSRWNWGGDRWTLTSVEAFDRTGVSTVNVRHVRPWLWRVSYRRIPASILAGILNFFGDGQCHLRTVNGTRHWERDQYFCFKYWRSSDIKFEDWIKLQIGLLGTCTNQINIQNQIWN